MTKQTEAFARTLIDAQLSNQDWQISDGTSVRYEYTLPNGNRADYMLCSREGRGLAIVEAKRESMNAADAREQGRSNAEQAKVPFVFLANGNEVAAGVKQQLEADAKRIPGLRLLPGRFMVIEQAMGLPKTRGTAAQACLADFVEVMKSSGFVADSLARHRIEGAAVAPATA